VKQARKGLSVSSGKHGRCTLCQVVLAGWLPIPNRPEAFMLLYHLGAHHLAEAKPYLVRMERECIDTVVMELFERVAVH
jgi:hypothetical protein